MMVCKMKFGSEGATSLNAICQIVNPHNLSIPNSWLELGEIILVRYLKALALRSLINLTTLILIKLKLKFQRYSRLIRLTQLIYHQYLLHWIINMLLWHTIQAIECLGVICWLGLEHFIVSNNHLFMALGSWCRFKSNVLCCGCCSKMVALIHVPLSLLPGVKSIFWVYFQLVSIRPHLVDVRWSWRTFYLNVLTKQWIIFGFALWIRRFRFCFIIYFVVFFLMKDLTSLLCHS